MLYSVAAVAVLGASTLVGAAPVINARKAAPTGWAHKVLEDYNQYHTRYLALSCYTQHNTTFFEDCCHPMRVNETLEDTRLAYCAPNATALASASARVAAAATAAVSAIPSDDSAPQWVEQVVASSSAAAIPTGELAAAAPSSSSEAAPSSSSEAAPAAPTSTEAAPAPVAAEETTTEAAATTTSTTEEPKWTPTSTSTEEQPKWTPTSTTEEQPEQTYTGGSGGSGATYEGTGTWYKQSEGADPSNKGSCGRESTDSDYVVAISTTHGSTWGNSKCFQYVMVTNKANGKSVKAQIVDNCPSCNSADSLDLSPPAFEAIADLSTGEIDISWQFI